jgi:1,4-alpha-glucan branching enzyme
MAEIPGGRYYKADWNDDFHHALHVAVTGEAVGYYEPFKDDTWGKLRRVMAQGYLRPGKPTVSDTPPPTESLPPTAFVHFLQNHDQVGNRAFGDRLHLGIDRQLYRALTEVLLLSPQIPLLFMGDDHLSLSPFHFFTDYDGEIAKAVRENRPKEAANFGGIPEGKSAADMRDPNAYDTFACSKLNWDEAKSEDGVARAEHIRSVIGVRRERVVPLLADAGRYCGTALHAPDKCLFIDWRLGSRILQLRANLSEDHVPLPTGLDNRVYCSAEPAVDTVLRSKSVQVFIR